MRQFINGSNSNWKQLEHQATGKCIRFRDQEMPSGSIPCQAHVGFEIDPRSQAAILYVQYGVKYPGQNRELQKWFQIGEKRFANFSNLQSWINQELGPTYNTLPASSNDFTTSNLENLTDLDAIHKKVQKCEKLPFLNKNDLFKGLFRRVRGQDSALRKLSSSIVRHFARLYPTRPEVLFAVGPSGVGKTRTAESLPAVLRELNTNDTGYQFLRLDMSEYQEAHRVSQLIGAPQGYVGYDDGSQLVDTLRANPRSIVLFDEIEKAHPAILRLLMNAMDAGRLSTATRSSLDRNVDCRHAVFIFTSNLDAKEILDELDSRKAFSNRAVEDDICRRRLYSTGFAPEIVGRIGRFLVFRHLSSETRAEIITLAIVEVAAEYGIEVSYVNPGIIVDLMKQIRYRNFGVRPERFLIDDFLGEAFVKAAKKEIHNPVKVVGPPYRCESCQIANGRVAIGKN